VVTQLIGVVAVLAYSAIGTAVLLGVTRVIVGLRVDEQAEQVGLDIAQHRERIGH
jgi:Amt family ammonium transporter